MKRDMELMRKILFTLEDEFKPGEGVIWDLKVAEYDDLTIAEHCDLLYQEGLIRSYKATYGGDTIIGFAVGNISSGRYDYLELIRSDDIWGKTKNEIEEKKLPKTFEAIAKIAGIFAGNIIKEMNG